MLLTTFNLSVIAQNSLENSESNTEFISESKKFEVYINRIKKYVNYDVDLATSAIDTCLNIIDQGTIIHDSLRMEFVRIHIRVKYFKFESLEAYKLLVENKYLAESEKVDRKQVNHFKYLEAFTYMTLGDLEAAQAAYYEGIRRGKDQNDSLAIINNLFSLSQVYYDDTQYHEALRALSEIEPYAAQNKNVSLNTLASIDLEIGLNLKNLDKHEQAIASFQSALKKIGNENLNYLKSNLYTQQGESFLITNKIDSAMNVYDKLASMDMDNDDFIKQNALLLETEILKKKKQYSKAIEKYKVLLDVIENNDFIAELGVYANLHEVSNLNGDHNTAYMYQNKYIELKEKIDNDEKRQKTAYLKVKYESDQKEKDNAKLKADLYKKQAEQNFLFGGLAFVSALLLSFLGLFYQKNNYSKKLEDTVAQRTKKLEESNEKLNTSYEELNELNRILSHDLKEPIRGIVCFSELADTKNISENKKSEYLKLVKNNGTQLNTLINDVIMFREIISLGPDKYKLLKPAQILNKVVTDIESAYPDKDIIFFLTMTQKFMHLNGYYNICLKH